MYTAEIVSVAKRDNNKKRNYLVLNRYQGKHIPASPEKALDWVRSDMIPYYPLGVYKDVDAIEGGAAK